MLDGPDDLNSLFEGDDRVFPLVLLEQLVGGNSDDKAIAHRPSISQNIQVTDVKEIEDPRCVTHDHPVAS